MRLGECGNVIGQAARFNGFTLLRYWWDVDSCYGDDLISDELIT